MLKITQCHLHNAKLLKDRHLQFLHDLFHTIMQITLNSFFQLGNNFSLLPHALLIVMKNFTFRTNKILKLLFRLPLSETSVKLKLTICIRQENKMPRVRHILVDHISGR